LTSSAINHLQNIPTILLDHAGVQTHLTPTIRFTTAAYGIHLPGTAYRMDEVPIPLRKLLHTDYPSDADVIARIRREIQSFGAA
jgi:formylmethanofuran dehydrogenase subunit B